MRVVTVWCPDWPITAAGVVPGVAAMVVQSNRVVACSPAAAVDGVAVGQRRRVAQRVCPNALVLDQDPDRDMRAFEAVVAEVGRFTPRIEVSDAGCLSFDARGPSRYFGGEAKFIARLAASLAALLPASPRVAVADGRFASSVAARSGNEGGSRLIPAGGSQTFLAPLPVEWLNLAGTIDADLIELFAQLGLRRLGDLASLPPPAVLARFGRHGALARQLAAGTDDDPLVTHEPRQSEIAERRLDTPAEEVEPAIFLVKHLADQLAARLAVDGRTCTRLVVTAETDHAEVSERSWYRAAGLGSAAMVDRGRWQLGAWIDSGAPSAGIVLIRLTAAETRADDGEPTRLWGGPTDLDRRAARATARLAGLVGDEAVQVPIWAGGQLHDQRWRWTSASTVDLTDPNGARSRVQPVDGEGPWPGAMPPPAPLYLPAIPEVAELRDREGEPVFVNARGELASVPASLTIGSGAAEAVIGWAGPWPVQSRWWDSARRQRVARLQIVTGSGCAHVLLVEQGRWRVVGTYT